MRLALFSRAQQFMAKKAAKAAATAASKNLSRKAEERAAEARRKAAAELAKARRNKAGESVNRALGKWIKANMPMKANKTEIGVLLSKFMNTVENLGITQSDADKHVNLLLRRLTEAGLMIVDMTTCRS